MKRLVLASVTSPSIMSLRNATAGLVTPIGAPPKRTVARPTRKNQIEPGRQAASPAADVSVFVSCCARVCRVWMLKTLKTMKSLVAYGLEAKTFKTR